MNGTETEIVIKSMVIGVLLGAAVIAGTLLVPVLDGVELDERRWTAAPVHAANGLVLYSFRGKLDRAYSYSLMPAHSLMPAAGQPKASPASQPDQRSTALAGW